MSKITSEKINQLHPEWEFPEFEIDEINKKKHKYCVCVLLSMRRAHSKTATENEAIG